MAESERPGPVGRALALAREHPGWVAVSKWLAVLTVLAALPVDPQGPYDARTYERAPGFRLVFPASGALVEPLAAPARAIAGAPNPLVAAISTVAWVFLVAAGVTFLWRPRGSLCAVGVGASPRRLLAALTAGAAAVGVLLVYVAFALVVRLPSWRLEPGEAGWLIADLQTHTFGSHDGVISARENLEWHARCGCDVVAVTEHDDAAGSFEAQALAAFFSDELPAVIAGVEMRSRQGAYLLALGLDPGGGGDGGLARLKEREDLFCQAAHRLHGGAVVALAWHLDAEDVRRLGEAGVDGFEIANFGHPEIPRDVRRAILDEGRKRGLVLVASSDWHGWGGFWRTWTAVRVRHAGKGAGELAPRERAEEVLAALRERRAEDIMPLVAGRLGRPALARAVLAPLVEPLRYAAELFAVRVASWWVWAGLLLLADAFLGAGLRRRGLRPGRLLLALLLLVLGSGLVWRAVSLWRALLWARAAGMTTHEAPRAAGGAAAVMGLVALAAAAAMAFREFLRLRAGGPEDRS